MPRINLTVRKLESLKPSPAGQIDYWDRTFPKFGVRVTPQGRKTWMVFYRYNRRIRRLTLGTFPPLSLQKARELARNALSKLHEGVDPAREHQLTRREGTFGDLADDYMKIHARPKKKSWRQDKWLIDSQLLPRWRHVKAKDINRPDVLSLVEAIVDRGRPVLANRTLALISKIFAVGIDRGFRVDNPCHGLSRPGRESTRDRVLSADEIKTVWDALQHEEPFHRALFQLRLLTAARGGEIRQMRWQDIDLNTGWWTISAEFAKNGVSHTVPLNAQARSILRDLHEWQAKRLDEINAGRRKKKLPMREPSEWVFPSPRGDDEPFQWEQRATDRIRRTSGVDFRPHDLRRTAATLLTTYEYADRFLLKRILNHVDRDITGVYDRNRYDAAKRVALDRWGRRLDAILKGKEKNANIATFKPASGRRS